MRSYQFTEYERYLLHDALGTALDYDAAYDGNRELAMQLRDRLFYGDDSLKDLTPED